MHSISPTSARSFIEPEQSGFDWREYYYAIKARAWIIILCLMISVLWGVYSAATQKITYSARSVLYIEQGKSNLLKDKVEEVRDDQIKSADMINTLVDLLQQYQFALRVVKSQKLAQDPEFLAAAGISGGQTSPENAAGILSGMVKADYRLGTRLIDIFVTTENPNLSVKLANAYPDEYFRYLNEQRVDSTRSATAFLMEEVERLRKKMRASEEGMQNFRERERAASFDSMLQEAQSQITELATRQNLIQSKLTQITSDLEVAKANQGSPEELLRLPSVAGDSDIASYLAQLAALQKEFVLVKQRYRAKHPLYISIKTQIDLENQEINRELSDVVGLLARMRDSLLAQQAAAKAEREESEKRLLQVTSKSIEYNDLKRELEGDAALYDTVLNRIKEVDVTKEMTESPVRLHEAAIGASMVGKLPLAILLKAIFNGLAVGLVLVIALYKLDTSLKTVDQVERYTGLPVVAAIPQIGVRTGGTGLFSKEQSSLLGKTWSSTFSTLFAGSKSAPEKWNELCDLWRPVMAMISNPHAMIRLPEGSELVVNEDRSGGVAEAFRSLRASIATNAHVENQRTFLFTSAVPSEGKSFCSANFAITLAHQGFKTLLVDADLRKPILSRLFFGMHRKPGLSEILLGSSSFMQSLQATQVEGLSLLTAGGRSSNPSELLPGQNFRDFITEALQHFDRVVFDSAPLLAVSDTILIAPNVDVFCLVARSFMSPRKMITRAIKTLAEAHLKPDGIVFNCLPATGSYYYYYSGKYYGTYGSKGVYGNAE